MAGSTWNSNTNASFHIPSSSLFISYLTVRATDSAINKYRPSRTPNYRRRTPVYMHCLPFVEACVIYWTDWIGRRPWSAGDVCRGRRRDPASSWQDDDPSGATGESSVGRFSHPQRHFLSYSNCAAQSLTARQKLVLCCTLENERWLPLGLQPYVFLSSSCVLLFVWMSTVRRNGILLIQYSRTPLIRMLVIRLADHPDRLGSSGIFVANSTKPTCLEITIYRIKYSTYYKQ